MAVGAASSNATMTAKATYWWRGTGAMRAGAAVPASWSMLFMSSGSPEQAGRLDQQHDGHDDEDHRVGGFGIEHLGQPLDDAKHEAGDDRAHDGAHAADQDEGKADKCRVRGEEV